jgi:hypothetical protein
VEAVAESHDHGKAAFHAFRPLDLPPGDVLQLAAKARTFKVNVRSASRPRRRIPAPAHPPSLPAWPLNCALSATTHTFIESSPVTAIAFNWIRFVYYSTSLTRVTNAPVARSAAHEALLSFGFLMHQWGVRVRRSSVSLLTQPVAYIFHICATGYSD